MSEQIAVRLSDPRSSELDELVRSGQFPSRAEAVRRAIGELVDRERRARLGASIAAGYQRILQTDEEVAVAEAAAVRSIHEEPW